MKRETAFQILVLVTSFFSGITYAESSRTELLGTPTRYGPLNLFDSQSDYGKGVFPEPFLIDDSDLEVNELRLDWLHTEGPGNQVNAFNTEIEHGFGEMTLELEVHYDYDTYRSFNSSLRRGTFERDSAFDNVDLGARHPIYQYVSQDGFLDTTFGVGIEVGIPTNSILGKNTEIVPKAFNDTRIGDHFTVQSIFGYSYLLGSKPDGGTKTFEYGFLFGWTIYRHELPIPGVQQTIPILELSGTTLTNTSDAGSNALIGNAAVRFNLKSIGRFQPRLGLGYVFPIDKGARADTHWGIFTSIVVEF